MIIQVHFFLQFEIDSYCCLLPGKKTGSQPPFRNIKVPARPSPATPYWPPGPALKKLPLASQAVPTASPAIPRSPAAGLGQAASQKPREGSAFYGTRKGHIWREGSAMYGQGSACVEPSASRFRSALALRPGSDGWGGSFNCEGKAAGTRRGQARGRLPQDRAYSSQASGAAGPLGPPLARLGGSSSFPPQCASLPFPRLGRLQE